MTAQFDQLVDLWRSLHMCGRLFDRGDADPDIAMVAEPLLERGPCESSPQTGAGLIAKLLPALWAFRSEGGHGEVVADVG